MAQNNRKETPIIAIVGQGWSVESAFTKYGAYSFSITDKKDEKAAIQFADGIVFTGGGDVHPHRYGATDIHDEVYGVSEHRDDQEFRMVALARKRGIPMFGICRGLQVLNVAHGGTLYQDIKTPLSHSGNQHAVSLIRGSGVQTSLGVLWIKGTSLHHQAIDKLGDGLRAVGRAQDSIIEMIESEEGVWPYVLATQFHPEMDHKDEGSAAGDIFRHFVSVCALKSGRRKPLDIRKPALWKARGSYQPPKQNHAYNYSQHRQGVTNPSKDRAYHPVWTLEEWQEREACPHGYKYHCGTSSLCKFDDGGYIQVGFVVDDKIDDEWIWSESLEAWILKDYAEKDDSDEYINWLEVQSKWNDAIRKENDDSLPFTGSEIELYGEYDGWF